MKSVMKTLQQLLMKKKTIVNLKKALERWKLKEVILKKRYLIEAGKTKGTAKDIKRNEFINNNLKSKI